MNTIPDGASALHARCRVLPAACCWLLCARVWAHVPLFPVTRLYGLRDQQSSVKLPRARPRPPSRCRPTGTPPITAEPIIEQMKLAAAERPTATNTNLTGRGGKPAAPNAAVPDYKAGPGDALTIPSWTTPGFTTPPVNTVRQTSWHRGE